MGMEYEKKFRCDLQQQAAILREIDGRRQEYTMQTTYFDTPDAALSSRKWTLRCRRENDLHICTLKTPAAGDARQEWETEEEDIEKSIEKLCKLGAPEELQSLCAGGVAAICGAAFTRTAVTVLFRQSVLELALDAGVLTGGGRQQELREVEVELKDGSIADADAFADQLAARYQLKTEGKSKFRRALELYRGE